MLQNAHHSQSQKPHRPTLTNPLYLPHIDEFDMEDADTVLMPMDLNMVQHESNNGLAINEQNGIPYVTYISKLLGATHAMRPDILYATVMMAQEDWTGVKRILRYLKRTIDFALTCGGKGGIGNQS